MILMILASASSRGEVPAGFRNVYILTVVSCAKAGVSPAVAAMAPPNATESKVLRNMVSSPP